MPERARLSAGERIDAQLLSDLWVFRAVARAGRMAVAAEELNVTAGAVSQRVLRLEGRLNIPLFERRKNKLQLTAAGSSLLDAMNGVSLLLGNCLAHLERPQHNFISASCGQSLATQWLLPNLMEFYREFPGIELLIRSETASASPTWMADEGVDILIQYGHRRTEGLVELGSVQELTFAVCSPAFRSWLRSLPQEERTVMAIHDTDAWREGEPQRAEWQEWLAGVGSGCTFLMGSERHFNQAQLAYQAASYGQGVAIGRSVSVNSFLEQKKLVPVVDARLVPSAHYRILSRIEPAPGSPAALFAAWAIRLLQQTQRRTLDWLDELT